MSSHGQGQRGSREPAVASAAAVKITPTDPYAGRERHHNEGHGRRLTAAFEALEAYPMLVESRNRVLRLFEDGEPPMAEVVAAVEADVSLTVTVVRLANQLEGPLAGRVMTRRRRSRRSRPRTVHAIATRARTFDFFERSAVWQGIPERFRLHAVATQRAADRLGARDRLRSPRPTDGHLAAARHRQARARRTPTPVTRPRCTATPAPPRSASSASAANSGVDHALVGGVLARRWGLPPARSQA